MNILALDLGTNTGYAIGDENGLIASGCKCFKGKSIGHAYANMFQWLTDELTHRHIDEVWYEQVMGHLGAHAAHAYGGFHAIMSLCCLLNGEVPVSGYHVATIKKYITGDGRADKETVIKSVSNRIGQPWDLDNNTADAIAIYLMAMEKHSVIGKTKTISVGTNDGNTRVQLPKVQRTCK